MLNKIKSWFSAVQNETATTFDFLDPSKKTILIIDDDLPQHDKSSGSKRLFELLKLFKKLNLNIIFLPNNGLKLEPYYTELKQYGVEVLLNNPDRKGLLNTLNQLLNKIDYAWISRPMLNIEFQKLIKKNKNTKIIFDTVDLHFVRMLRQAENENSEKLKRKAIKFKKLELELANKSDATITVTDTEKVLLENENIKNVYVVPNIHQLQMPLQEISFKDRKGIVFIGGYKHEPNIDAVKWFMHEILPKIWNSLGKIPVYLLGSFPTNEISAFANENVFVPGYIEDVSEYFLKSKVFIAPLRYGAGMKGKIGQSLEFGLPIVSTSIGAEGMNLIHENNVLIADEADDFANEVIRLYQNENLWNEIKENAFQAIVAYTPKVVESKLETIFKNLGA
ncbi:glycosyltransferase family 4 protein [Pedobacter jamesrossensis]|uniref:Glycosyltransferase family 4 protein n=1 Tax=Pedobacter jamesrossensis TaxID=1908238 RepID=A0ABV8NPE8_9SPHI